MKSLFLSSAALAVSMQVLAQEAVPPPPDAPRPFGPPGMGAERKIVKQFDKDGDKRLDPAERAEARQFLKKIPLEEAVARVVRVDFVRPAEAAEKRNR